LLDLRWRLLPSAFQPQSPVSFCITQFWVT